MLHLCCNRVQYKQTTGAWMEILTGDLTRFLLSTGYCVYQLLRCTYQITRTTDISTTESLVYLPAYRNAQVAEHLFDNAYQHHAEKFVHNWTGFCRCRGDFKGELCRDFCCAFFKQSQVSLLVDIQWSVLQKRRVVTEELISMQVS